MKHLFLLIATINFFPVYTGPTELFENFLKTNPTPDNLAKELDKLSNVSVRSVALKRAQAKYGAAVKGELEVIIKAPSGQAVWSLNNYRSSSKPIVITKTEIVKDTAESERLKAENARLAAQLAAAEGKHEDLQKELEFARSQQNSPVSSRRGSESDISVVPVAPPAPVLPGGVMPLGGGNKPALPGGLLMQLGGKKQEEKEQIAEEQKIGDKQNLTAEDKKLSDKEVIAVLLILSGTEGSYDKINSFEQKIYDSLKALRKNKLFNNRAKLEEVEKELKALLEKHKPTKDADFKEYYREKTAKFSVGSAGEIEIVIFDTVTQKYTDFLESLKKIVDSLFFNHPLEQDFSKRALELFTINYLAAQRKNVEIPKEQEKPTNRTDKYKQSDRALMGTIIDAVELLKLDQKKLTLTQAEQEEKADNLRNALDWLRINPAFMGYKKMLPSNKEASDKKPIPGAQPEVPLLLLINQEKPISPDALKKELLNHLYLDQGGLEDFLNHLDQDPNQKTVAKMALLLSKPKKEGAKEEKKVVGISDGAKKLLEILVGVRKTCKEDRSKNFETLLLAEIEQNKAILEPLNKEKYSNLTKMLGSFERTADKLLIIFKTLLGENESRFLEEIQSIKDANKTLGIPVSLKDTSNIKPFTLIEIDRLMGETPIAIKQCNDLLLDLDKAEKKDWFNIYLKFAANFSSQKQTVNKTIKDFDSAELQAITLLFKNSFDSKKETITTDAIAAMAVKELHEIKNIADSKIKDLYKTKGAQVAKEITDLMHKQILETKFAQANNQELEKFTKKLQEHLATALPLVYEKTLTDAYQKARKAHEKI